MRWQSKYCLKMGSSSFLSTSPASSHPLRCDLLNHRFYTKTNKHVEKSNKTVAFMLNKKITDNYKALEKYVHRVNLTFVYQVQRMTSLARPDLICP